MKLFHKSILRPLITRKFSVPNKDESVMDRIMNIHFMLSIPAGCIGFCYGVNESWKENVFQDDLVKSSLAATTYGVFGFMFGTVSWFFTPIILPVAGASYIKNKFKK